MAYIGNTVQNQGFAPAVDYFNGDGTTVTFTLSRPVASVAQLTAVIENVIQNPSTAFTVSGSSITFTSAPPSGTNNIWVEYTSLITTYAAISQDPTVIGDITATGGYSATGDYGNSFVDGVIVDYVTGNARITTGTSDGITLYNGGTSARSALMTITSAGNVGIGTTSPSGKVHVYQASGTQRSYFESGSAHSNVRLIAANTSYNTSVEFFSGASNIANINALGAGGLTFETNGSERARIDSSGNVGIGTASPISNGGYGGLSLNGTSGALFSLMTNGTESGRIASLGNETSVQCKASTGYITFVQGVSGGAERMRIDTEGYLQAHAGTGSLTSPNYHSFRTATNSTTWVMFQRHETSTAGNAYGTRIEYRNVAPNGAGNEFLWCNDSSTVRASIRSNGGLANYSANNANLSDIRTKTDIELAGDYLDKICAIPVKTFKYKDQTDDDLNLGVIAQDVEAVAPELVDVSGFGETPEDGVPLKAVYQTDLQYALMKCIQEQQAIINDLKARIETLESK